jgi:hypothetical protein
MPTGEFISMVDFFAYDIYNRLKSQQDVRNQPETGDRGSPHFAAEIPGYDNLLSREYGSHDG